MSNRPEDSNSVPAVPGGWRTVGKGVSTPKEAVEENAPATSLLPTHPEPEQPGGWYVPSYAQDPVASMNATAASTNLTASPAAESLPDNGDKASGLGEPAPVPSTTQAAPPVSETKEESPTMGEPAPIPLATGTAPAP